ncbi:MAG TPA: hypothetical protein VIK24_18085 [Pyrinomonadaceae bacterium]
METKWLITSVYPPINPERLRKIIEPTGKVFTEQGEKAGSNKVVYRIHVIFLAALCLLCSSILVLAQATSSDYTNDLPSVERVKAEIKGSDPTDTLARQVAVFTYLQTYIDRIKSNRSQRGSFTPGESKMWNAYRNAAYQISQDYAKTHTPAEAQTFERLHGYYTLNGPFYDDWSKRLIGPQSSAAYKKAESDLAATGERHYQQQMEQYRKDRAAQQAADRQVNGPPGLLSDDPTAVATRRCLELGGDQVGCTGKGLHAGFMDLIGFGADVQESLMGPGIAGVILRGVHKNPNTVTTLNFGEDSVALDGCGKLDGDVRNYKIEKRSGLVRITVDNEPNPIVLTMRPDGGLTGPGLIDVKGHVIVGYFTTTHYENGVATGTTRAPDYRPAMGRCVIGSLVAPANPKPVSPAQSVDDSSPIGVLTGVLGTLGPDAGEVGLRMTGQYGGGQMLLDFRGNSLVIDCGLAHVRQPYSVENTSNALLVHVKNSAGPFTLVVQPDNSLRGSGGTTINGRLVTGMSGNNVTFAPVSETCDVEIFRPKTGAGSKSSVTTTAPPPATVAKPATTVSAPAQAGGTNITITIISSFSGGANPLAGAGVALMSERFDTVLRKVGAPIAVDVTPGKALQAYATNCLPPRSCPAYATAMHPYYVVKGNFDSAGRAVLMAQIPPGTYYVICSAKGPNGVLVWDVPAQLKVGENTITLTAANGELIH